MFSNYLRQWTSKLIFAYAQNNHFQNGKLQNLIVANEWPPVYIMLDDRSEPTSFIH